MLVVAGYILFLMVFGTLNTLTTKWQFSMSAVGEDGLAKHFQKPWWGNFAMFAAMVGVLGVDKIVNGSSSKGKGGAEPDRETPLLGGQSPRTALQQKKYRDFLAVGVPAVLDLVSSGLNFIGLLYISASVWQMLRGSMIVFSAFLSILFLKRRMYGFNWLGIAVCVLGISCVGAASVLGGDGSDGSNQPADASTGTTATAPSDGNNAAALGVAFVMAAQVLQAAQCVAEERLLKNVEMGCFTLVGYEGVWGCLVMLLFVFPLCEVLPGSDVGGVQENTIDTLTMLSNSLGLQTMLAIYLCSCCTYNVARMLVTSSLSAVHFTMIDASRTALVWGIDLAITYFAPAQYAEFGELWNDYSWLQAVGFVTLICGQCIYGGLLTLPFPSLYPEDEKDLASFVASPMPSPASRYLATPLPPYSPPYEDMYVNTKRDKSWTNLNNENPFGGAAAPAGVTN
ncbi:unnamed protein product [Amoebophrya sp. A120]|nr:unnamed protein product [Amoebophrya sp. A120]|eukprot:GSA120T00001288001.1